MGFFTNALLSKIGAQASPGIIFDVFGEKMTRAYSGGSDPFLLIIF